MRFRFIVLLALSALPVILAAQELPEGKGKATTQRLCGKCHGAQIVLGKPHSEEGWAAIVENMVQRGMQANEEELYDVIEYLAKNIKAAPIRINVNKASAKELEKGLELTPKEAEAIVQAREKGDFKTLEDLKKVPGVDAAKIDAKKMRVVF